MRLQWLLAVACAARPGRETAPHPDRRLAVTARRLGIDHSTLSRRIKDLTSSNLLAQCYMALASYGTCILPCFTAAGADRLQHLFANSVALSRSSWLIVHAEPRDLARIRVTADFIGDRMRAEYGLFQQADDDTAPPDSIFPGIAILRQGTRAIVSAGFDGILCRESPAPSQMPCRPMSGTRAG